MRGATLSQKIEKVIQSNKQGVELIYLTRTEEVMDLRKLLQKKRWEE